MVSWIEGAARGVGSTLQDVSIDLSSAVPVAEKLLDSADISPALEQMRVEAVPESMRGSRL